MRLSLRLALILGVALALVLCASFLSFIYLQRSARVFGVVLPRPARVAAMAELIEKTPPANWTIATAALSSSVTDIRVLDALPQTSGGRPMPGVAGALRAYVSAMEGRPVSLMAELEQESQSPDIQVGAEQLRATRPVRILVSLHNGKILMIEARGPLSQRFTGLRLGFLALLITVIIGVASAWVIGRQLKPLEHLATAVEKFGTKLETSRLPEEGSVELRQVIAAFNRLQSNIGDLVKGRTRLITAVGHDLGTYLTRLRLRAEYISDAEQRDKAIRDIDDMHRLMSETLALAKLEHDSRGSEPVDIVPLLQKQVLSFAELGAAHYDGATTPLAVRINAAAFERALGNLISNALKYGHETRVSAEARAGEVHITVEDRGPGIPVQERAAVLEPFYRLDAARNLNQRGFGLGLAIAAEVVKSAGGTLTFEDRDGGGLRVRMVFPSAQA